MFPLVGLRSASPAMFPERVEWSSRPSSPSGCWHSWGARGPCWRRFGLAGGAGATAGALLAIGVTSYSVICVTYAVPALGVALELFIAASAFVLAISRSVLRRVRRTVVPLVLVIAGVLTATLGAVRPVGCRPRSVRVCDDTDCCLDITQRQRDTVVARKLATRFRPTAFPHRRLAPERSSSVTGRHSTADSALLEMVPRLNDTWPPHTIDFAISAAAQSCGLLAVAGLLWALGYSTQVVLGGAAFLAAVPTTYVNTVFTGQRSSRGLTWSPRLQCWWRAREGVATQERRSYWPLCSRLPGFFAHGGAVFVLPAVAALCLALRRERPAVGARAVLAVGVAAALYAPWAIFQPHRRAARGRTLKWHLAGVVSRDDRGFVRASDDQYLHLAPYDFVAARLNVEGRAVARRADRVECLGAGMAGSRPARPVLRHRRRAGHRLLPNLPALRRCHPERTSIRPGSIHARCNWSRHCNGRMHRLVGLDSVPT